MSFKSWESRNFMTPWPVKIWRRLVLAAKFFRFAKSISKNKKGTAP